MENLDQWLGHEERLADVATAAPAHLLAATLDRDELDFRPGDLLPPAWHWLYFLRAVRTREVGPDGHPPRGGFLPPVPLPRRMRAGGDFRFERPICIGDALERRSRIARISEKSGSSGPLVFVRVEHQIRANGELAIIEGEDLVYRGASTTAAPASAGAAAVGSSASSAMADDGASQYPTNPMLLFRVSALTFNGHRIHYDSEYARSEEGYPGLVVHGPLLALYMLEHLHKTLPAAALRSFKYRAVAPTFCGDRVFVTDAPGAAPGQRRVVARNRAGDDAVVGEAVHDA